MSTTSKKLKEWVDSIVAIAQPTKVHWCDGSDAEYEKIVAQMTHEGDLISLNLT